jgi:peptidyl-dipeptidase Dcp
MRVTLSILAVLALAAPAIAAPPMSAQNPNPLLAEWKAPFGVPPFEQIKASHFLPAFEEAIRLHNLEIAAIAGSAAAPSFENTVAALDDSGERLTSVAEVFGVLTSAETNDELAAIEAKVRPMLAAHADDIFLDEALFKRVKAVQENRATLKLKPEEDTLLGTTYRRFVRGGANLDAARKTRLRAINAELSGLIVKFSDNLLDETNGYKLVVETKADLAGLQEGQIAAAAEAAKEAGLPG